MGISSDVITIATAKAKPGKEKELEQALRAVAAPTRAQPGCIVFNLHRSVDDPGVIMGFERWASKEEHDRHMEGAHFQKLMVAMADIVAEPPKIAWYQIMDEK
jgi:quinol monooxygenase YgiN